MKRWTEEEEKILVSQVRAFPQNLHKCFCIVAQQTGRTESAVASHWYSKTSKDEKNLCFFTASSKHVSRNRKNGMGDKINSTIWVRLIAVLKKVFK